MKKRLMIIVVCMLFVAGCGDKRLVCTNTDSLDETIKEELSFVFSKSGNLKSYTLSEEQSYTDNATLEEVHEELTEFCDEYKTNKGITCTAKKNGKKLTLLIGATISELEEEILAESQEFASRSYEQLKNKLESEGYSCR